MNPPISGEELLPATPRVEKLMSASGPRPGLCRELRPLNGVPANGKTLLYTASFPATLSILAADRIVSGFVRRSLTTAVTAIDNTSSPQRRPFGQPPATAPPPKPVWMLLCRVSPPNTLWFEKPASSG